MRLIVEKKYPADWFRGKNILARKYLGEKISYTFMAYNPGKKILHRYIVCRGKKIYYQRFGEKKFPPKPNYYSPRLLHSPHQLTHTFPAPTPDKSQMKI